MTTDPYRFLLRMPQALRSRVAEAAERSGRSLNAEIVHRLERSLEPRPRRALRSVRPLAAGLAAFGALGTAALVGVSAGHRIGVELSERRPHASAPPDALTLYPELARRYGLEHAPR